MGRWERMMHRWRMKRLCPHPTHMMECAHGGTQRENPELVNLNAWCLECDEFVHGPLAICTETGVPHLVATKRRLGAIRSLPWRSRSQT